MSGEAGWPACTCFSLALTHTLVFTLFQIIETKVRSRLSPEPQLLVQRQTEEVMVPESPGLPLCLLCVLFLASGHCPGRRSGLVSGSLVRKPSRVSRRRVLSAPYNMWWRESVGRTIVALKKRLVCCYVGEIWGLRASRLPPPSPQTESQSERYRMGVSRSYPDLEMMS